MESASPEILRKINKGSTDIKKIEKKIWQVIQVGIVPHLFLMIGSPGETKKTLQQTIRFVDQFPRQKIKLSFGLLYAYPQTTTWQIGVAEGRLQDWSDIEKWAGTIGNQFTPREIRRLRARFAMHVAWRTLQSNFCWQQTRKFMCEFPKRAWQAVK